MTEGPSAAAPGPASDATSANAGSASSEVGSRIASEIVRGTPSSEVLSESDLERAKAAVGIRGALDDLELRKRYAKWLLIGLGVELFWVNVIFLAYCEGNNWDVPANVIQLFLGSTVLQVFGVVLVITKYLFPVRK